MSLKDLFLEQINLTSGPDKIKLRVDTVLQLDVPRDLAQSPSENILLSLTSGKLWATRVPSCSLDFCIDLEDDELEIESRNQIVETLGHRIRDAHLWSQLFLSTSLDIPQSNDSTKFSFSVRLGHSKPPLNSEVHPGDWLAGNIDVQPPDGVRRATVQGLQIRLKVQLVKPRRPPKKLKPTDTADSILLSLERFEGIVMNLSETLPLAVTNSFRLFGSEDPHFDSILDEPPLWDQNLKDEFGASEHMLLAPCDPAAIEDNMLLSQSTDSVPSLRSQSSTISSLSFQSSLSLKRHKPPSSPVITARTVQRLVDIAVHTLLEGPQTRRPKGFQHITTDPPKPSCSLAELCPGIFNLGIKEGMASNNQFLTTITRTISSWPQNVQSPSLRKKLAQLGNQGDDGNDSSNQTPINSTSLSTVVSSKLWAMMQKKLLVSSFSRKLAWEVLDDKENFGQNGNLDCPADNILDDEGFENLLADDGPDEKDGDQDILEDILEFEDLLVDDTASEAGLLDCLGETERERREIENETDEMLFGSLGNEDEEESTRDGEGDDSMMLLEDRQEGDEKSMLI